MCCEERFVRELRERGLRLTLQRETVLRILHEATEHPTAEEIHAWANAVCPAIDLSTVYRTLDLLQSIDLVASFDLGDGHRCYELLSVHRPHHHLLCQRCGKLATIDATEVQPLLDALRHGHGFEAQLEHLVIPGCCQECLQAAEQAAGSAQQVA